MEHLITMIVLVPGPHLLALSRRYPQIRTTASGTTSGITSINPSAPAPVRREVTRLPRVFSHSPTLEQPSPHAENDVAIQSPPNMPINVQPPIPEVDFPYERQSPYDNVTAIVDAAARNLRRTPPAKTSNTQLRPNTSSQRKAQPLFTTYLPNTLTDYITPERKMSKQSDAKRIKKVSAQKRKMQNQK